MKWNLLVKMVLAVMKIGGRKKGLRVEVESK